MWPKTASISVVIFGFFTVMSEAFTKGQSPDKLGYATPPWAQEHVSSLLKQFIENMKGWDRDYLTTEAGRFFSGCENARGWLQDWKNLTGQCLTTVDSGYIGCVGAVNYSPGVGPIAMTPTETQELYKLTIQKIVDKWRETNILQNPDVDWIHRQPEVYVGCSINPFCEKYIDNADPSDDLALEGPEGFGTFENIFVLACNLGTSTRPSMFEENQQRPDDLTDDIP